MLLAPLSGHALLIGTQTMASIMWDHKTLIVDTGTKGASLAVWDVQAH